MTYRPPETCPRCRDAVRQLWDGDDPKCIRCGWADYERPLRAVATGIQVPLSDDFEIERLMFNERAGAFGFGGGLDAARASTAGGSRAAGNRDRGALAGARGRRKPLGGVPSMVGGVGTPLRLAG